MISSSKELGLLQLEFPDPQSSPSSLWDRKDGAPANDLWLVQLILIN